MKTSCSPPAQCVGTRRFLQTQARLLIIAAITALVPGTLPAGVIVHLAGEGSYTNTGSSGENPVLYQSLYPTPGTPAFVPDGAIRQAMAFTNATGISPARWGNMLEFTASTGLHFPSGSPFTFETWIKPTAGYNEFYESVFTMSVNNTDRWNLTLWRTGGTFGFGADTRAIWNVGTAALNTWQHVALVYQGTTLAFYHNGVLKGSVNVALNMAGTLKICAKDPYRNWNGFNGYIDEFRVHDVALSAADLQNIVVNESPVAEAGTDAVLACTGPLTTVTLDGSASYDPNGDVLDYEWSVPAGSGAQLNDPFSAKPTGSFPVGPTLLTLTVSDGRGGIGVDDVLVTVVDDMPPALLCTTDKIALWPPTHNMEAVAIYVLVSDQCSPSNLTVTCVATSSEPDDGKGDGSTTGDVNGQDGFLAPVPVPLTYNGVGYVGTVMLRAERNGGNKGRDYSIVCEVSDASGNKTTASCVVVVPANQKKK